MKIIPAILPMRYYDIPNGVEKVSSAVNTIQVDFVDGNYAPNRTWWFNNKDKERLTFILNQDEGLPEWQKMNYEFDLMIKDPLQSIDTFITLGPSKIIFHLGSIVESDLINFFESLSGIVKDTIDFGIAIAVDEDPQKLKPFLSYIKTVQCMGIAQVGFQAQPFDLRVIEQIKKVKNLCADIEISVDGGVNLDTASELAKAGATSLIAGSVVFQNNDPESIIKRLKQICYQALSVQEN